MQIYEEIRQWGGALFALITAVATSAGAIFLWRAQRPIVEATATLQNDGRIRFEFWITNQSRHILVFANIEVVKPPGSLIGADAPQFSPKAIWPKGREIAPEKTEFIRFFIQLPEGGHSPKSCVIRYTIGDRLRKMRTRRYMIKRSISD